MAAFSFVLKTGGLWGVGFWGLRSSNLDQNERGPLLFRQNCAVALSFPDMNMPLGPVMHRDTFCVAENAFVAPWIESIGGEDGPARTLKIILIVGA